MNRIVLIMALVLWPITAMAGSHHHHGERSIHDPQHPFSDWFCVFGNGRVCHDGTASPKRVRVHTGSQVQTRSFASVRKLPSVSIKRSSRRHLQPPAAVAERTVITKEEGRRLADYLLPIDRINEAFAVVGGTIGRFDK